MWRILFIFLFKSGVFNIIVAS